ncbi:hypothetical protein KQI85_16120, partial [Falcatimonas sp. MSJ-15]|uniref:hypothetical protein n=1 Tax=Falcatimonas sp. MSJ-15 TaxID=2841515 RepID=UPI00352FF25C|nr:hypothetical protein [Falcatimonas sp. MSJ-15]
MFHGTDVFISAWKLYDKAGRTTQYTYDAYGNCTSVTDAQSHTSYTEYDLCGRITKST